uniref:Rho-GAP domain-containing protein n=1 Tax=Mesocestoides corti TaxID=53468 RepID=A0A5K3EH32_MESCO
MSSGQFSRSNSLRVSAKNGSTGRIQLIQHRGWLRKQGGKFRTWKRRFFVLRQGCLEYYADSEQIRLLGSFKIGPPEIMEVVTCETDVTADDKTFNFIVKKSRAWGSDQKQVLILSASSANERREWIRALRKQLYLKLGGGIFGTHLSEAFAFTSPEMKYVPRVVFQTAEFIRQNGLTADGIFRKCGARHVIDELCEAYDTAQPDPILRVGEHDAHAAAGVLKQYLRELPEPVIPYRQYDRLKATGYLIDDGQDLKPIIDQLECLPAPNYRLLQFICQLLSEVAGHSEENRMTVENLASIFAPNILRHADYDPDIEMSATPVITLTIAGFIRRHEELFRCELLHFAQLQTAALAANSSAQVLRQNFSEPPEGSPGRSPHSTWHKSGSLTDSSNSHSPNQIWFPHERCRSRIPSRQLTIATSSPSRRFNGRTSSGERGFSSGGSHASLRVPKNYSPSPVGRNGSGNREGSGGLLGEVELADGAEQLRYWRSVALVARAEAVCERARSQALTSELARARCDLDMAEAELGLLRKRLALLESTLARRDTPTDGASALQ